jgi:hypothetical protein
MYFLDTLVGGQAYTWEVKLKISGGTATIGRGEAHALLQGQGLVAKEEWDGLIEIAEEYSLTKHGKKTFAYTGETSFIWYDVETVTASDTYSLTKHGKKSFDYTDEMNIHMIKQRFRIVSEDGQFVIVSEDGQYIIDSEE